MAEKTMTERVARALCALKYADDHIDEFWPDFVVPARAAIESMREPTEAMVDAGAHASEQSHCTYHGPTATRITWPAMIDAALREGKQ